MKSIISGESERQELEQLRRELGNLDQMIVALLNERQKLSHKVQMHKQSLGMERKDPEQEARVIKRIRQSNPGPMTCEALEEIYRAIFNNVVAEI